MWMWRKFWSMNKSSKEKLFKFHKLVTEISISHYDQKEFIEIVNSIFENLFPKEIQKEKEEDLKEFLEFIDSQRDGDDYIGFRD
jgi:hypothetical protein